MGTLLSSNKQYASAEDASRLSNASDAKCCSYRLRRLKKKDHKIKYKNNAGISYDHVKQMVLIIFYITYVLASWVNLTKLRRVNAAVNRTHFVNGSSFSALI